MTCAWCNCEVVTSDANNPINMFYASDGERIFLHEFCKQTYIDKVAKIENNLSLSVSAVSGSWPPSVGRAIPVWYYKGLSG